MNYRIYLSPPHMGGKEMEYIREAFEYNWIAPCGPSVSAFEVEMAEYLGVKSALALSSGTAGIHLALRWLGVEQGDYVFCSDLTFIGSCDAILYEKCVPVFIDSEPDSWNMSPEALKKAFQWAKRENKMPKAVIIVDLYGESADWDSLLPICREYNVPVIEDAAEAVGAVYEGKKCGSFGDISVLSFNGNKIITTSSGGMVLSNNEVAVEKMRFWSTQAREPFIHYEHKEYGYNYRMSNICACIGRGQLDHLPYKLDARKRIHGEYQKKLRSLPIQIKSATRQEATNYWLSLMVLENSKVTPLDIIYHLKEKQIESRPIWKPMHMQPLFKDSVLFRHEDGQPSVGERIFQCGVCLPSGDRMTESDQTDVTEAIKVFFVEYVKQAVPTVRCACPVTVR